MSTFEDRAVELQRRMADEHVGVMLLSDPDSIYYISGYWGYLGVEFGRPTLIVVPQVGDCTIITPLMESGMASNMTWIQDIRKWEDGIDGEWMSLLGELLNQYRQASLAIERLRIPALVSEFLRSEFASEKFVDGSRMLGEMRMIKSPDEIAVMRQIGRAHV